MVDNIFGLLILRQENWGNVPGFIYILIENRITILLHKLKQNDNFAWMGNPVENIDFSPELTYSFSRSGGKGGQHVNKTETKVHLYFDVANSLLLDDEQKENIFQRMGNYLSAEGVLQLSCDSARSQTANKKEVTERFYQYIKEALKEEKERIPTKIPKAKKKKRLKNKRKQSEKKKYRQKPDIPPSEN